MSSEGESAILELETGARDDDEDEEESSTRGADSVTLQDLDTPPPLIMEHGQDIVVMVDGPLKQLATLETFVTYRVRCMCARWSCPPYVRRRYNHFKVLRQRLVCAHPLLPIPPLPPLHSPRQQLDRYSPIFVALRALALNAFLGRVAKHPILTHSDDLRIFLTTPDEDLDRTFKSESGALSLWGLTNALYSPSEPRTPNSTRIKDPEFSSASDYLVSLQQKLTTLCNYTTRLYKDSAVLGNELIGLKRACEAWGAREGGAVGRCGCALGCGAGHAGSARTSLAVKTASHRAVLPLLAAYASTVREKLQERDALHAAYISSNNTGALHNRLEQASEALRSELSDWNTKTRSEIKTLLLELADRQLWIHQQTVMAWEHALKLATETNAEDIFKTVSKNAVLNLSPTKCKAVTPPTETDKDIDDDFDVSIELEKDNSEERNYTELQIENNLEEAINDDIENSVTPRNSDNEHNSVNSFPEAGDEHSVLDKVNDDARTKKIENVNSDPLSDFADVDLSTEGL